MIRPHELEVPPITHPDDAEERVRLERLFDEAILDASVSGEWPARAKSIRPYRAANLRAVVVLYRSEHWAVTPGDGQECLAEIFRPGAS